MSLLRSGLLNAVSVMVRIGTGLVLNKILAVFVGPAGYAVIGQFQNLVSMGAALASGGVNTGVTKYTAEHWDDAGSQKAFWRTAFMLSTGSSFVIVIMIIFFREALSRYFLKDVQYSVVFVWFGGALNFLVWNGLLLAILNGLKQLRQFVLINIMGSLIGLAVTGGLVVLSGLKGGLIALAINQSVVFVAAIVVCRKDVWFSVDSLWGKFDREAARKLLGFTLMALVSAFSTLGSQMLVRNYLGEQFGWNAAGYWQAMTRISDLYLMLITTTLSYYYLPRLSEIKTGRELKNEVLNAYKYLLPLAAVSALGIYLFRGVITRLLFSESFLPMESLFFWQLLGDVMKIGSWLLAYLMLAKAMAKRFIVTEVLFSLSFVILTIILTSKLGLVGAVVAFAFNYLVYWIAMYFICRKVFG